MLACLLAIAMAIKVRHDFISLNELDVKLEARLSDGWEIVFSNFVTASPGHLNSEAKMLFIFKKTTS
jgi:hypothetical protein